MSSQSSPLTDGNVASESISHGAIVADNDTISRNPYRQNLVTSALPLPRSASEETQSSVPGRIKPVRAVFHDLPTAHSTITSGTARSRSRRPSSNLSPAYEEEDSIPLQEIDLKRSDSTAQSFPDKLPLLPLPVASIDCRYNNQSKNSESCLLTEESKFASQTQSKKTKLAQHSEFTGQSNSVLANVKSAFTTIYSPVIASTPSIWFGSSRNKGKQRPSYPETGSSIYHSGLGAAPSGSLAPNSAETKPAPNPDVRRQKHSYDSYNDAIPFPDLQSTPAPHEGSSSLPTKSFKTTRVLSHAASSLPEGSTVGNIYKAYATSDAREDGNCDSDDAQSEFDLADGYFIRRQPAKIHAQNQALQAGSSSNTQQYETALDVRKQRRAERAQSNSYGQPPGYALPSTPSPPAPFLHSSSQGIANSSSYGDTHNLLDLADPSRWIGGNLALSLSNARNDLKSDQTPSQIGHSPHPYLSPNNPFRNWVPQSFVSQANPEADGNVDRDEGHHCYNNTADRQPLEREVSEALRRASNFSTYSSGSIAASVLEHYAQYQSGASNFNEMGLLRRHIECSPPSDSEVFDKETRQASSSAQAFYEKGAISSDNWIATHQRNEVRIPIIQTTQFPKSPPVSSQDFADLGSQSQAYLTESGDDGNDWETVGESAVETDFKDSTTSMLGGEMAHRAGSSIANTSDEGTASTHIPEISNYGSTERIAQHPGNIQYSGDYRQRDLKKTHIPVFLPVFREHKVNGYLADSNRTRPPPNPYSNIPTPLNRKHTNPFNSSPPEIMHGNVSKTYGDLNYKNRSRNPNHFPPPISIETLSSSEESNSPKEQVGPDSRTRQTVAEINSRLYNWMDDFGDPGPEVNHSKHAFLKPILSVSEEDRPSSWQHIMTYAAGGSVEGYNENGFRLHESPFGTRGGRGIMRDQSLSRFYFSGSSEVGPNAYTDGFVEQKTYGGKPVEHSRERSTLIKGPPGAFYHGLSRPKQTSRSQSHDSERAHRVRVPYHGSSAKEYPTNSLRPLSLVASRQRERPVTPLDNIGPDPSGVVTPNDFVYLSPLAPPKRKSWQRLYTPEHLSEIRAAAKSDGIFDNRASQATGPDTGLLRDSVNQGGSRKHLWESPRLFHWNPEPSPRTDLAQRKKKISNIVLCLCNLFPPLLLLFGLGAMDGIMNWWTGGEAMQFGKGHKRTALILLIVWGCVTLIGLIGFLIYWFTTSHS